VWGNAIGCKNFYGGGFRPNIPTSPTGVGVLQAAGGGGGDGQAEGAGGEQAGGGPQQGRERREVGRRGPASGARR